MNFNSINNEDKYDEYCYDVDLWPKPMNISMEDGDNEIDDLV